MDAKVMKVLSKQDLRRLVDQKTGLSPIAIARSYTKNLKTNLLVPSRINSYSKCIEYMSNWFYSKFPDDFFKQKHLEAEHILNWRLRYPSREFLTYTKPACGLRVTLDDSYNRELLDQYNYGDSVYTNRARYKDMFFQDPKRSLMIGLTMEMLLLKFNFKMLFAEQGIQMDIVAKCQLMFKSNATQKHYVDVDYHIPDELLNQLAEDTNNFVCPYTNSIVDAEKFVNYFNQHSLLPLYYKFDPGKHKMQYYLRIPRCLIHIKTGEFNVEEGVRYGGNIHSNYKINFECQVRFPSVKFYSYMSIKQRENMMCVSQLDEKSFAIITTSLARIPSTNDKGWARKLETMYRFNTKEELEAIKNEELLSIDFAEMIGDLRDAIELTKSMALNPAVFLDMRVYNYFSEIPIHVDWYACRIDLLAPLSSAECCIVLYIDGVYYATVVDNLRQYHHHGIQLSNTILEHEEHEHKDITSLGRKEDMVKNNEIEDNKEFICPLKEV